MHYIYIILYMNIFIYHNKSQREYWTAFFKLHSWSTRIPTSKGCGPADVVNVLTAMVGLGPSRRNNLLGGGGGWTKGRGQMAKCSRDIVGVCGIIVGHMISIRLDWDEYWSNMIK